MPHLPGTQAGQHTGHHGCPVHRRQAGSIAQSAPSIAQPTLYAPYGLEELYAGLLKPNPACPHLPLFEAKAQSYRERWPWLTIQAAGHVAA